MSNIKDLLKSYAWQAILFASIMTCGTYVFSYMEKHQEEVKREAEKTFQSIEEDIMIEYNISKSALDTYVKKRLFSETLQGGLTKIQAFRLSLSIAFTTGMGYFVPTTNISKIFFLCYTFVSIVSATVVLKTSSDILTLLIRKLICKFETFLCARSYSKHLPLKVLLIVCILTIAFISFSTYGLMKLDLSTLDAIYLCIQIYSTIGFGDLDINHNTANQLSQILLMIWNTLGMILLATIINAVVSFKEEEGYTDNQSDCIASAQTRNINGNTKKDVVTMTSFDRCDFQE